MVGWKNNRGVRGAGPGRTAVGLAWLLAFVLLSGCGGGPPSGEAGSSGGERRASGTTEKLGTPARGSEDAPVVLTEYSDYQ